MKKSEKVIIFILYFIIIVLSILFFYDPEIIYEMILPKYYTKFDNLEKVTISYNPSNSPYEDYHTIEDYPELKDIPACQIEVTDKSFIKLIKDNYESKILVKHKRRYNIGERKF